MGGVDVDSWKGEAETKKKKNTELAEGNEKKPSRLERLWKESTGNEKKSQGKKELTIGRGDHWANRKLGRREKKK